MRISSDYASSLRALSSYASRNVENSLGQVPKFKLASQMAYAEQIKIQKKAEALIEKLVKHIKTLSPDPKLFFTEGEIVPIPDIHGDFTHLIKTLYRHGLLDENLNLRREYTYVLLGDIYDRGRVSDVVDFWLNRQIERGVSIYRIAGNHEMMFVARDKKGNPKFTPAQDSRQDKSNGFQVTEDILKGISEGTILGAFASLDKKHEVPISYSHSCLIGDDFETLEVDESDIFSGVAALNERFRELGADSYERFLASKEKDKYDWREINEPFTTEPIFDVQSEVNDVRTAIFSRRPIIWGKKKNKIARDLVEQIPKGVYQVVGHTTVETFPLSKNVSSTAPIIVGNQDSNGYVQFSDVAMGFNYRKKLKRPKVVINSQFAQHVK